MSKTESLQVGQTVQWVYAGTWRRGTVIAIVPPGEIPLKSGIPRDHESYLVAARKLNSIAQPTGTEHIVWPAVRLIRNKQ